MIKLFPNHIFEIIYLFFAGNVSERQIISYGLNTTMLDELIFNSFIP